MLFFFSCASAPSSAALGGQRGWRRARGRCARSCSLSSSASTSPARTMLVDVDVQLLDDAVRLRLDFDLGDRLDLAGGDDRPHHRAALDGRELGRVDVNRRALEGGVAPGARNQDDQDASGENRQFALLHVVLFVGRGIRWPALPGDYEPPEGGSFTSGYHGARPWPHPNPSRGARAGFAVRIPPKMSMWTLQTCEPSETGPLTFRLSAGAVKTVGRATRADFVLDAALVSRVHCRLSVTPD